MNGFNVLILGSASALPTVRRNHTSQLVTIDNQYLLIDCGEGTQIRLREHKIKFQRINHIFISHLHGDHSLGLMGLLQSMNLLGRQTVLNIYCCSNVEDIVNVHLKHSKGSFSYPINYHKFSDEKPIKILENKKIIVTTIPLKHRIPCTGFLIKEKNKPRKINTDAILKYKIPKFEIQKIKQGEDYMKDNFIIPNNQLTLQPSPSYSYAFCSDTAYHEKIINQIKGVDLLYHEATFTEEYTDRAYQTKHSTAKQAATIALKAKVNQLIIGHFSNRYTNLEELLSEATSTFKNTSLAEEGKKFKVTKTQ